MRGRVVLTADRTLMSGYRNHVFLGFGSCAPSNIIPDWLYRLLFFPSVESCKGVPVAAPYGLRKIEAALLLNGFNVVCVDPDYLSFYLRDAEVLGVYVMDPFGLGPASTTLASFARGEPFLSRYFRFLMESKPVLEARKRGLKIIVGGPGVWQFKLRRRFIKRYGVDCIVEGEGEKVIGRLVQAALNGERLPEYYTVSGEESPNLDEIPLITAPSISGLVEVGRGCCRGCRFCSVTLKPLRWIPQDRILREVEVNLKVNRSVTLHAEDVLLYGSSNTIPVEDKLIKLHEALKSKKCEVGWSHCSLAAVAAKPGAFKKTAEIILENQDWWGAEVGIETGSPRLAEKIMPTKAHPFKPGEWPNIVKEGLSLMHDNMLIPACTLIAGSPGEREEDVVKTIELVEDLKPYRFLIVPLYFVPLGSLKDENWFLNFKPDSVYQELFIKCLRHDLKWIGSIIDIAFKNSWHGKLAKTLYKLFVKLLEFNVLKTGVLNGKTLIPG
ncbi:MAG: B12-binding domain-containing radical SAM protein [Candidatus Odinarchaeum yellowstonii]|uniref:B12-binding domain-containing radical SAM protein n=1 Tax=Odinarchaeota yellowstonii (strain LCB_4) TaxID=1841599 RepID=A0AAF0D1Z3_ODILC|nr:MAG: B12-binding domain-containing radical SAM protein [Candidatus Odinarchaeum yellowstonii]